jgi:hypothetical protein
MKRTTHTPSLFHLFASCGSAGILLAGCSLFGPSVDPEKQKQSQELSLVRAEIMQIQAENRTLNEKNQRVLSQVENQSSQLDQLKNHTQDQQDALRRRDDMINDLTNRVQDQERRLSEKQNELVVLKTQVEAPPVQVVSQPAPPAPVMEAPVESSQKGPYHLRIVSLPGNDRYEKYLKELKEHLARKSVSDIVVRKSGSYWVMDIGYFDSYKDGDAVALRDKIRGLDYEGRKQFKDCYYVKY